VTFGEAFTVQPFGNLLVTMDLTGAQVEQVLEQQAVPGRPGGRDILILGISRGLRFNYCAGCAFGARVDAVTLNGIPVNPLTTYRVTVNSFLADGGDAFTVLTQGTNRLGGGDDLAAFTTYLTANSPSHRRRRTASTRSRRRHRRAQLVPGRSVGRGPATGAP